MRHLSYGHTLAGRSHPWVAALSAKLTEITPEQYQYFFFASIGSDAVESAVKMALPHGKVVVKVVKGGLDVPDEEAGEVAVIASAAVAVRLDLPQAK